MNSKVFIIIYNGLDCNRNVVQVFDTEEKADAWIKQTGWGYHSEIHHYEIEEHIVQ